ncbi:hypothetical protein AB7X34_01880 [Proteus mirabilis]|nr:hypothetical protein [Proteus mirabilis]MCI9740270.1 hypothetical protein [Proteus mirabilis]MCI9754202.1 hypothetical protein [Proteus mirabilis]MCI9764879.1 hypothetical protein [Proteus mirabilis]MDX4950807.1 hypothetical protein [Proteus mirabilis]WOQ85832.1 hypothetical protein R2B79_19475 [Proteus mirabilis]
MKLTISLPFILITTLISVPALGNSYSAMEGIEGQRYSDLEKYKANCPACMSVVQNIIDIRYRACAQSVTVDDVIIRDPLYGYLNSMKFMLNNDLYNQVLSIVISEKDCIDSLNWLERANLKIESLVNKPI